ncbi:hypothetical protein GQ600_26904 [Phytophthora cactorum]|nr:hypothetical protein GQ600_26904 [Phytophthora cactorum]
MHYQAAIFFGAFVSALVTSIDAGSVEFTSYFEGDDCSGTPHFIYEKTLNDCKVEGCIMTTIGVDCYENDRVGTATIYADADAPYVLLEHYSPPTGCEKWVNGLAFYAMDSVVFSRGRVVYCCHCCCQRELVAGIAAVQRCRVYRRCE